MNNSDDSNKRRSQQTHNCRQHESDDCHKVIGTFASAPCYGNVVTPAKSVPVGDGADDLEAAVDAATTPAVPLQPSGDDPLGSTK